MWRQTIYGDGAPRFFYCRAIYPIAPTESTLRLNTSVLRKSTRGLTFSHQQEAERITRPKFCDDQSFTFYTQAAASFHPLKAHAAKYVASCQRNVLSAKNIDSSILLLFFYPWV